MIYSIFLFLIFVIVYSNFVKTQFINSCTEPKTIALTFDDGPYKYTNDLINYIISKPDVKITLFHVAKLHYPYAVDIQEYQNAIKKAHDYGFQIASHSYSHKISEVTEEFRKSLVDMDEFVEAITGDRPRYFRAPKGHCDEKCQAHLNEWGYRLIQWDTDTKDNDLEISGSVQRRVEDSINLLRDEFAKEKDSYLILMHDSQNYTVNEITPWIIEQSGMKEKGYRFVTVAECLGDKNGEYSSKRTYIDDNSTDDVLTTIIIGNNTIIDGESSIYIDKSRDNNINNNNDDHDTNYHSENTSFILTDQDIGQNLDSSSNISSTPMSFLIYFFLNILFIVFYFH